MNQINEFDVRQRREQQWTNPRVHELTETILTETDGGKFLHYFLNL